MYDLKKHLADFGASRWDAWKAQLANDVIYEEIATHTRVKSADDYLKIVQRWKRAFPDLAATIVSSVAAGDKIIAEVEWEGTQTGPLEGPFGTIPASNKRGLLRAVLISTIKNDKVVELHQYFDVLTLLANVGIAPFAGAAAPAKASAPVGAPRRP